jgi:protein-S-isoprenylcysteine O-methyltransferase Ste14
MKERKTWFLPSVMTVLMVSQIVLVFFLYNQDGLEALRYVGWAILAVSAVFGWMPIFILRRKGGVPKGKSYVRTTVLVTSGIYAVVRHPQSGLAGILLSLALILIAQHWVIAIIGVAAMVVVYLGTRQEDRYCVEKFGDDYKRYMQSVPAVDLFTGVIRLLRRRRRE